MATHTVMIFSIFQAMLVIFHPPKTEYEIETKETMKTEQKAIVLGTKEYIKYCNLDKRLLCWPKWSKNALKLESKFL